MESYNYLLEEDDEDKIVYYFSSHQSYYSAVFDPHQYSDRVDMYPALLTNGVGFSFFNFKFNESTVNDHDQRVGATVSHILTDFINTQPEGTIVLYHCDHGDGKQKQRSRKFEYWEKLYNKEGKIYRRELPIEHDEKIYYIGYITTSANDLKEINDEFDRFACDLTSEEKPSSE